MLGTSNKKGCLTLNAPISGGPGGAAAGMLTDMVGGAVKVFAAGADIKKMQSLSYADMHSADFLDRWDVLATPPSRQYRAKRSVEAANWRKYAISFFVPIPRRLTSQRSSLA